MIEFLKKKGELKKKENELEHLRRKILRGEVSGNGAPVLIQQLEAEILKLKNQIQSNTSLVRSKNMPEHKFTQRQLKQQIRQSAIEEVISGLDLEMAKHAIDIKEEDLVEVANMVQTHEGPRAERLAKMLIGTQMVLFHNFATCKIPPKTKIELIMIDDIYVIKVLK